MANRVASAQVHPPRLALRPWRVERREFGAALRRLASEHRALVFADVAACYPSIAAEQVRGALEALGCSTAEEIEAFLHRTAASGIPGLPVGPDPSAVLANAVLAHVDRALVGRGLRHLRWVDDVVIGIGSPDETGAVLDHLDEALRAIGLRRNVQKTRVVLDAGALVRAPSGLLGPGPRLR